MICLVRAGSYCVVMRFHGTSMLRMPSSTFCVAGPGDAADWLACLACIASSRSAGTH